MVKRRFVQRNRRIITWFFGAALAPLLMFSHSYWERIDLISSALFLMGTVLVGVATVGRLWCLLYIAGYKTNTLIVTGPYSMCRNPLYFFSFLGGLGLGLATETATVPLIIIAGFVLYYPLVIKAEERRLQSAHGKDFEDYLRSIPSFFPSLAKFVEPEHYTVNCASFRRGLFDAMWFVWLVGIVELVEALHEDNIVPIWLALY